MYINISLYDITVHIIQRLCSNIVIMYTILLYTTCVQGLKPMKVRSAKPHVRRVKAL